MTRRRPKASRKPVRRVDTPDELGAFADDAVWSVDGADGLDAFAPEPAQGSPEGLSSQEPDDAPPELVWLADATDGLEAFVPEPDRVLRLNATATLADAGVSASVMDVPIATPEVGAVLTGSDVAKPHPPRFDWMNRAHAALVCTVLAAAGGGFLVFQQSGVPPAVEQPQPPNDARQARDAVDHALQPAVAGLLSVPQLVVRTTSSGSPSLESDARRAPTIGPPDSNVRTMARDARDVQEAPAEDLTPVPEPPALASAAVAAAMLAPVAPAPAPTETDRSAPANEPLPTVAGHSGRELEARAIENVLGRYRTAFNTLDAGAALAVWPTVNEKTLARAFERLEDQDVSFDSCQIEVATVLAEAACSGSASYVPKVGSRTPKAEARQWTFSLRKADGGWLIDRVDVRAASTPP